MKKTLKNTVQILLMGLCFSCYAQENRLEEYMGTQSMKWEQLPLQWNEGAFLGNGKIGMVVYVDTLDNSLTCWLSRPDVTDHRKAPDKKTSMGVKGASVMLDYCRMDVGKMKLYPQAKILDGSMELDIYNAELKGELKTDKGIIRLRAYTPYDMELNAVEIETDLPYQWKLLPGSPQSPRIQCFPNKRAEDNYVDNPTPLCVNKQHVGWSVHPLLAGGDYATYWKECKIDNGSVLLLSTKNEVPSSDVSLKKAKEEVKRAELRGTVEIRKAMYDWWNRYYEYGMIDIPDKQMENFYHIQLYKLATCSHPEGPAMDVYGTFYKTSQWPGIWWNLNIQLTYGATLVTNRLAQAANYVRLIDEYFFPMMNAKGSSTAGDFVWSLYIYYSCLRHEGKSWKHIYENVMPKAEALLEVYKPHLKEKDGVIHLLQTLSPEYKQFTLFDNGNYNLAALRWLLTTMVDLSDRTGNKSETYDGWKNLLVRLHSAPVDENGYRIGSDQAVDMSHRHYSHLLAFYPLRLVDVTVPENRDLLEKSIDHWLTVGGGKGLAGYSYTGSASLYAYAGLGNKAYRQASHFLNESIGIGLLLPNTLYVESKGKNPVIETPLSEATAIGEMLLQGWGETIRLFPAVPDNWKDCSFNRLRVEGGFEVSASRKDGKLSWVTIHSDAGQPCRLYLPDWEKVEQVNGEPIEIEPLGKGYYNLKIQKEQTVSLAENKDVSPVYLQTIPSAEESHYYGVKRGKGLPRQMDWRINN